MSQFIIVCLIVSLVAVTMTMVGKGGGNFYVLILVMAGIPMHQAAATGQFILFAAALAALLIFQKNKVVAWPLAIYIGTLTATSALAGGYFSHLFSGFSLKIIFAGLLAIAGAMMLVPVSDKTSLHGNRKFGYWSFNLGNDIHIVNSWIAIPVTILTGFGSGMVGVSGGSFLVPLMVLACGVPMHVAVGTASTLIAAIALMGFVGHAIQGDFNPSWAMPLAILTVIGGFIGGKFAMKTKPIHLKQLFAYTTWAASIVMVINAFYSN
jgi:uncharacterized membrane protein YfcA